MSDEFDDEPESGDAELEILQPTHNAGDARSIAEQQKLAEKTAAKAREFWIRSLQDEVGRKVLWDLLESLGTFADNFQCGPNGFPQPDATWFKAGQKAFGHRLYHTLILADRALVFTMHDEYDGNFARPGNKKRKRSA